MIRAIIFDCFGVLATGTWQNFIDSLPPDVDKQAVHDLNHAHDAGMLSDADFLFRIKDMTGQEPQRLDDIKTSEIVLNEPLLHYIRSLTENYKIGLLSNIASDWITTHLLNKKQQALFDDILMSYQVGMAKPDPRIFRLACERLKVDLTEAIFVDDVEPNVAAARQLGMHGILYKDLTDTKQRIDELLRATGSDV